MRQHIKLKPRQMRSLVVMTLMSFVLAVPMLAQPLGLAQVKPPDEVKPAGVLEKFESDPSETSLNSTKTLLEPAERMAIEADLIHRQKTDTDFSESDVVPEEEIVRQPLSEEELEAIAEAEAAAFAYEVDLSALLERSQEPYEWETVDYPLYITATTLNMRTQPHTDSDVLVKIDMAEKVSCIAEGKDWVRVKYKDYDGYIASEYTSKSMVFRPVEETRYVEASQLNLRAEPSTSSDVVTKLNNMQKLTRTGVGDGWSKIKTADGKVGYVASKYLTAQGPVVQPARSSSSSSSSTANAPRNSSGNRIVDYAYQALGVPYVYAGSSMRGMDCSGFTSWVYRQAGISIPRSSYAYNSVGVGVSYSNAQPGDILAMDTRRSNDGRTVISHVAIYIGNGQMIHASSSRQRIIVASVDSILNWGAKLVSVRRIPG